MQDIELAVAIESVFGSVDGIYGQPNIHHALPQQGTVPGKNLVVRLMQENGLKARCAQVYRNAARKRLILPAPFLISDRGSDLVATKYQNGLKGNGIIQRGYQNEQDN